MKTFWDRFLNGLDGLLSRSNFGGVGKAKHTETLCLIFLLLLLLLLEPSD